MLVVLVRFVRVGKGNGFGIKRVEGERGKFFCGRGWGVICREKGCI